MSKKSHGCVGNHAGVEPARSPASRRRPSSVSGVDTQANIRRDRLGLALARYKLTDAWPSKCAVSELKLEDSEVLVESVTVVAEPLQRVE